VSAPNHFTYHGHTDYVSAVAWSRDSKRIASASGDHTVQVWDAADGSHVLTYRGHSSDVLTLAWSPDGKYIASGSLDTTVQVWNATNGEQVFTYHGHSDAVFNVAWSPDGTRIASVGNDGSVQLWNSNTGGHVVSYKNPKSIKGGSAPWNSVAWSPDGKRLIVGGLGPAMLLDVATGNPITYFGNPGGSVHTVAWSPNGTYIASGRDNETVEVWNVDSSKNVHTFIGHTADVNSLAWSPDGKRIVSGSADGVVMVWDALTGDHVYTYRGHADYYWGHFTSGQPVNAVDWSPDGKRIASGSDDTTVQVWQAM